MSCVNPSSLSEGSSLCNTSPLAGLGLLHKVGWALGSESAFTAIRCNGQYARLDYHDNHLLVIEKDQNYTSSDVSVLFHKTGGEEGALI